MKVIGLAKSFGASEIFHDVSFEVRRGERAGLVGANGAGKTTLMRCLLGAEEADAGSVQLDDGAVIGYVEQQAAFGEGTLYEEFRRAFADVIELAERKRTLEGEIASADEEKIALYGRVVDAFERLGGYSFESRIRRVAFGLGFTEEDFSKDVRHFSGGQRTRICLAKALLREPDFLFLDEPTNHLDIKMIEWLEGFLADYAGGVLLISHDRFFLDRVATHILDLSGGTVTSYAGNYTYFQKVYAERQKSLLAAYEKQQEHIRRTEEFIRRYRAGVKAKQARGRESRLRRMERIVLAPEKASFSYFAFHPPAECAERVAELEDVTFSFSDRAVFSHLSLLVRRGDGIAVVGPNGAGKTTLLRVLLGELAAQAGRVKIGSRVKIGYFSQQHEGLHPENTLVGELNYDFGIAEEEARKYLGAFLFYGDEVFRRIGDLSGGEQARLAFLKLMLTGANFLVLDEPTNHLDIPAREAVEEALMAFPGTFVVVSHDRYFLDKVANTTAELANGTLREYEGNYSYYRMKKEIEEKEAAEAAAEKAGAKAKKAAKADAASAARRAADVSRTQAGASAGAAGGANASKTAEESAASRREQEQRRLASLSETRRTEMLARAEAEIAMAEAELKGLEFEMNQPEVQGDPEKSAEIAALYAAKEQEIEERYARWEALAE
ncbi:ABC-F family ATP-binding cassette domain-containing protein [Selenomonas sp.]|uniref:ABC-F family ATP-binding cassette domain-containing protein n=1 Tax=Selenomonas sp. TaxID=2053611 RepID=UPI003FA26CD4